MGAVAVGEPKPMMLEKDQLEPLIYGSRKIHWSRAFRDSKPVRAMFPLLGKGLSRTQDLGMYLYFVHDWRSPYHEWDVEDRINETLKERIIDPDWLKSILEKPETRTLVSYYRRMVLTAGQRMYQGLTEQITRWRNELSELQETDTDKVLKHLKAGEELLKSLKRVEQLMQEEGEVEVRGKYRPSPYELPPDQRD